MLPNLYLSADEKAELAAFTDSLERFCDAEIEPHYAAWEKAAVVVRHLPDLRRRLRALERVVGDSAPVAPAPVLAPATAAAGQGEDTPNQDNNDSARSDR